jgi:outer membrane protein OmpA-like peptidoglycan-associated protein
MKRALGIAATALLLPSVGLAQDINPLPGFYVGSGAGLGLSLTNTTSIGGSVWSDVGFGVGALFLGYDFVGLRTEIEVIYGQVNVHSQLPGVPQQLSATGRQVQVMAKALYDFFPASALTPYVGVGAGIAFVSTDTALFGSTQFGYEGILGLGWNIDSQWRVAVEGRYFGTTDPSFNLGNTVVTYRNNGLGLVVGAQYKFAPPAPAAAPPSPAPAAAPSFMVFFDWDRSNLSAQALATIKQAAGAYKAKGSARITATGHTDKSGPEAYNMALSLRRANAVKDALVREGVPAQAIAVIGRGESQPLVQTADGVREPQNRRVEIVLQ